MPDLVLVSARCAQDLDEDLAPLLAGARGRGWQAEVWAWDEPEHDWSACRLALLRSPWDYTTRYPEFLTWLDRIEGQTRLLNPPALLRWNTDKRYLGALQAEGVPIVPTQFLAPGHALPAELPAEFVLKPAVGAGSKGALRLQAHEHDRAQAHLADLHGAGQVALLQPYLDRVDAAGETGLIYFDGEFSHAIGKGPLLRRQSGPVEGLYALENIVARQPQPQQRQLADQVLAALRRLPVSDGQTPLYARVDLLEGPDGEPMLLELELAEPSLFFATAPGAAERLIEGVVKRFLD